MAKMDDDRLRSITDQEMRQAVGWYSGKLAIQRQKAMQYYLGLATGDLTPPEVEGRSAVVSRDVWDTVEWIKPQIADIFCSGDQVVLFSPTGPDDVQRAEQLLVAANAQIGVARAAMFPQITLTGFFGGDAVELAEVLKNPGRFWSLGVGLALPLFDGGRLAARVDQAGAAQREAVAA